MISYPISIFCKLDGKLARWDTEVKADDPATAVKSALAACRREVAYYKGKSSIVLAVPRLPLDNTSEQCDNTPRDPTLPPGPEAA